MKFALIIYIVNINFFLALSVAQDPRCEKPITEEIVGVDCPKETKTIWSYDKELNECIYEEYEGCEISGNQFLNAKDCSDICITVETTIPRTRSHRCEFDIDNLDFDDTNGTFCVKQKLALWAYNKDRNECFAHHRLLCNIHESLFDTLSECYHLCIPQGTTPTTRSILLDRCVKPTEEVPYGDCPTRTLKTWSYDFDLNECVYREYEGCKLAHNEFLELIDCNEICLKFEFKSTSSRPPRCHYRPKYGRVEYDCVETKQIVYSYSVVDDFCSGWIYRGCNNNSGNKFPTERICFDTCHVSEGYFTTPEYVCEQPRPTILTGCTLRTVWSYLPEADSCIHWQYAGCEPSGNLFKTEADCNYVCRKAPTTIVWYTPRTYCLVNPLLPAYPGECSVSKLWTYNRQTNTCDDFLYTACYLDSNMFEREEDCIDSCLITNETRIVQKASTVICEEPRIQQPRHTRCDLGEIVFFYERHLQRCAKSVYYGCELVGNIFPTLYLCDRICNPHFRAIWYHDVAAQLAAGNELGISTIPPFTEDVLIEKDNDDWSEPEPYEYYEEFPEE